MRCSAGRHVKLYVRGVMEIFRQRRCRNQVNWLESPTIACTIIATQIWLETDPGADGTIVTETTVCLDGYGNFAC
jgi:hypothetical protein